MTYLPNVLKARKAKLVFHYVFILLMIHEFFIEIEKFYYFYHKIGALCPMSFMHLLPPKPQRSFSFLLDLTRLVAEPLHKSWSKLCDVIALHYEQ